MTSQPPPNLNTQHFYYVKIVNSELIKVLYKEDSRLLQYCAEIQYMSPVRHDENPPRSLFII
jgi:hypothetical protein